MSFDETKHCRGTLQIQNMTANKLFRNLNRKFFLHINANYHVVCQVQLKFIFTANLFVQL